MKLKILRYTKKRKKINILKRTLFGNKDIRFGKNGKKLRHDLAITILAVVPTQKWQIGW